MTDGAKSSTAKVNDPASEVKRNSPIQGISTDGPRLCMGDVPDGSGRMAGSRGRAVTHRVPFSDKHNRYVINPLCYDQAVCWSTVSLLNLLINLKVHRRDKS